MGHGAAMADNTWRVTCINKSDRKNPHERIKKIGGVASNGPWTLTEDEAIAGMETNGWKFYVYDGKESAWVVIATRLGRKYLKTQPDGEIPDNLLSLPECPP
jgi:uncharacterized protein DUF3892